MNHMLYDSVYMKYLAQTDLQRKKEDQWLPRASGRENGGECQWVSFRGDEILKLNMVMDTQP